MATEIRNGPEASVSSLVAGIISDVQSLLKQQIAFLKQEIHSDFQKTKESALTMGAGLGVLLAGVMCTVPMLVHLIEWATAWPLWGCYALVGGALALVGGTVMYLGKKRFDSFNPLPDESAQLLKDNVQYLIKRH